MPPTKNTPEKPASEADSEQAQVEAALARTTQDGKGSGPVPPADFESFATEGVEKKPLLSVEEVTHEVLAGRWGATAAGSMKNLKDAGYDTDAVWAEFERRKAGGAPTAF